MNARPCVASLLLSALALAASCTCTFRYDPAHYVPGMVEIELVKEPPPGAINLAVMLRATPPDLQPLVGVLQRHGALGVTLSLGAGRQQEIPALLALPPAERPPSPRQILTIQFPTAVNLCKVARELNNTPGVVRAAPMPRMVAPDSQDPYLGNDMNDLAQTCGTEWYLWRTQVPQAWNSVDMTTPVVVAIIDQGFLVDHSELSTTFDPVHRYRPCEDDDHVGLGTAQGGAHGTAAASLVAAPMDTTGMVGVAPGATIWPVQVTCNEVGGTNPWAAGIEWVLRQTGSSAPKVVLLEAQSATFGNCEESVAIQDAIKRAVALKIPVVVAAGNGGVDVGKSSLKVRIDETGSILVGATTYGLGGYDNRRYGSSNHGARVVVSAPGDPTQGLALAADGRPCRSDFGMTSAAAAHVAGAVALMLRAKPTLTPDAVKLVFRGLPSGNITKLKRKKMGRFLLVSKAVEAAKLQ